MDRAEFERELEDNITKFVEFRLPDIDDDDEDEEDEEEGGDDGGAATARAASRARQLYAQQLPADPGTRAYAHIECMEATRAEYVYLFLRGKVHSTPDKIERLGVIIVEALKLYDRFPA